VITFPRPRPWGLVSSALWTRTPTGS
jgi:hypothetical protein